jgi:hypothetical protein
MLQRGVFLPRDATNMKRRSRLNNFGHSFCYIATSISNSSTFTVGRYFPFTIYRQVCVMTPNLHFLPTRRAWNGWASLAVGIAMLAASQCGIAQIPQNSGASQQENRTSPMGSQPDPAASAVHESQKPQTRDGSSATSRGKTGAKDHKTQGAGGFDNGLYGTGAGSNK